MASANSSCDTSGALCDLDWLRSTKLAAATRNQTAQVLGVDPRTVTRGINNGEIPSVKIGGRVLVPTAALRRLLGVEERRR